MFISPWIDRGTVLHGPSGPYPTQSLSIPQFQQPLKRFSIKKIFLTSVMHGPALLIVFSIERALEQIAQLHCQNQ